MITFLLFMFLGHLFAPEENGAWKLIEIFAALFFPVGVVAGMVIAWWKEFEGGLITIISMTIFSILILIPRGVDFERGVWVFILIAFPGVLFAIVGFLDKKQ